MLLYRLTLISKGSRMLIAVLLAIAFHVGLMQIEFTSGPVHMPSISLPQSVTVLLRQNTPANKQALQVVEERHESGREESPQEKIKTPLLHEIKLPAITDNRAAIIQPETALRVKTLQDPLAVIQEKSSGVSAEVKAPSSLPAENTPAVMDRAEDLPGEEEPAAPQPESPAGDEGEGGAVPGALQMAYPHYQLNRPPPYPDLARKRNQQGTVILQVLVNREGLVDDLAVDVSSGFSILDRAAVNAVRKWLFEPGRRGNMAIPMQVRVPVTFKLKK